LIPPTSAAELPSGFDPALFNPTLMWTEYANRLLGVATGLLIFATLVAAIRLHRHSRGVLWPSVAAFVLVGYEGWLGGRVVAHALAPWIVTTHLVVALGIGTLLLYATVHAFFPGRLLLPGLERRQISRAAWAVFGLTLLQVALGTQVRGRIEDAAHAEVVPRSGLLATVGVTDSLHRNMAIVVFLAALALAYHVRRRHSGQPWLVGTASAMVALAGLQILVGVVLAHAALPPSAQVAHVSLASLLMGAETLLALLAVRLADPEGDGVVH
jgi:cytochrome c oxidase assembly protein subunit 15